ESARHEGSPVAWSLLSLPWSIPESCRGPIKTTRSGALTQPGARAPSGPTSSGPGGAFVPGCLSSVVKLPDTPGYPPVLPMVSPLSLIGVIGLARGSHGTDRPSRSHRSSTAGYRLWPVAQHHNSRALPLAPQPKQCHTPRPRCAEKERLRGELAPCNGHGPRTSSPRRSPGCPPSSSSTQASRASRRAWRKSTSGMAGLLPPGQRRGTRFVFIGLAAPEAVLVERLGFPPQVVDRPGQSRRQDGQGLA